MDTKESILVGHRWKQRLGAAVRQSRICILCWSAEARDSEYVRFEYSRAEGLGKPVLPWLLDATPLPQIIDIQGVEGRAVEDAVAELLRRLGWRLPVRRRLQAAAGLVILAAACLGFWWMHRPPTTWEFSGKLTDSETKLPLAGVRVEVEGGRFVVYSDDQGVYRLQLAQPRPKVLHLVFLKQGYKGKVPVALHPEDRKFDTDMVRLRE